MSKNGNDADGTVGQGEPVPISMDAGEDGQGTERGGGNSDSGQKREGAMGRHVRQANWLVLPKSLPVDRNSIVSPEFIMGSSI